MHLPGGIRKDRHYLSRHRRLRYETLEDRRLLSVNLVENPGFEYGTPDTGARPTDFAHWRGDKVEYVEQENGIRLLIRRPYTLCVFPMS